MVWVSSVWPTLRAWHVMFRIQEPPIFNIPRLYITHGQSAIFAHFLSTWICVILHSQEHPIQGLMVWVSSVWPTLRTWHVMFRIQEPPIFNNYTKSITHGQSAIFARFLSTWICVILHSQEHPIQGLMVWVSSVWPTLRTWHVMFRIQEPPIFNIPRL